MKFAQHFMDSTGKWRVVEQAGPPSLEVWRASWEVFTVAAIALGLAHAAVLSRYALKFEERVSRYPQAWHIGVRADNLCRSEFWAAERRRQARFATAHPGMSAVDDAMPWNTVIKESTENMEFWLNELLGPALRYCSSRGDDAPPDAYQQREQGKGKGKKGDMGKDGGHPKQYKKVFKTNHNGKPICWKFNNGECGDGCYRDHQCSKCLGPHSAKNCDKAGAGGKTKTKGNQKGAGATGASR